MQCPRLKHATSKHCPRVASDRPKHSNSTAFQKGVSRWTFPSKSPSNIKTLGLVTNQPSRGPRVTWARSGKHQQKERQQQQQQRAYSEDWRHDESVPEELRQRIHQLLTLEPFDISASFDESQQQQQQQDQSPSSALLEKCLEEFDCLEDEGEDGGNIMAEGDGDKLSISCVTSEDEDEDLQDLVATGETTFATPYALFLKQPRNLMKRDLTLLHPFEEDDDEGEPASTSREDEFSKNTSGGSTGIDTGTAAGTVEAAVEGRIEPEAKARTKSSETQEEHEDAAGLKNTSESSPIPSHFEAPKNKTSKLGASDVKEGLHKKKRGPKNLKNRSKTEYKDKVSGALKATTQKTDSKGSSSKNRSMNKTHLEKHHDRSKTKSKNQRTKANQDATHSENHQGQKEECQEENEVIRTKLKNFRSSKVLVLFKKYLLEEYKTPDNRSPLKPGQFFGSIRTSKGEEDGQENEEERESTGSEQ
ncbi:uncharacterized protein LOC143027936 [Oratosquilla oratoria]|uniref:uncharacterized protein LOC143027936 n=1 Tax=Oratosquilla oratoria TaxID=337810 RepID=UPI003F769328